MKIQENKVELSDIIKNRRKDLRMEMELKPINILKDEIQTSKPDTSNKSQQITVSKKHSIKTMMWLLSVNTNQPHHQWVIFQI